jgi:acyl carrier protein
MNDKTAYALNLVRQTLTRYTDTPPDEIQLETALASLQVDSLTLAELLFELEDRLGVTLSETSTVPRLISDVIVLIEPFISDSDIQNAA